MISQQGWTTDYARILHSGNKVFLVQCSRLKLKEGEGEYIDVWIHVSLANGEMGGDRMTQLARARACVSVCVVDATLSAQHSV